MSSRALHGVGSVEQAPGSRQILHTDPIITPVLALSMYVLGEGGNTMDPCQQLQRSALHGTGSSMYGDPLFAAPEALPVLAVKPQPFPLKKNFQHRLCPASSEFNAGITHRHCIPPSCDIYLLNEDVEIRRNVRPRCDSHAGAAQRTKSVHYCQVVFLHHRNARESHQ
jgi:hypothetical protein